MMDYEYYLETLQELKNLYSKQNGIEIKPDCEILLEDEQKICTILKGKFCSGWIVTTKTIECWIKEPENEIERQLRLEWVQMCLFRHINGDWGKICLEDFLTNQQGLRDGERLMSVYETSNDSFLKSNRTIWIITEWDRSVTTILDPMDY